MNTTELAADLQEHGVAGWIDTLLNDVHRKARMLASGDPGTTFGLNDLLPTTKEEVLQALSELGGWNFTPEGEIRGKSYVDPGNVASQAETIAGRLTEACANGERVLFGTGHPVGPLEMYIRLANAMEAKGAEIIRCADGESFEGYVGGATIRWVGDVACVSMGGDLIHTHSPRAMEFLLRHDMPDLVVGDHGFAGAGLAAGAHAAALVDTNDPALVLAWARDLPVDVILGDDARPSYAYHQLTDFLIERL